MNLFRKYLLLLLLLSSFSSFGQSGCTDYLATNFDPTAVTSDGSCVYPYTTLPLTFKCYIDSFEIAETSGIVNQENNFWTHVDDSYNIIYKVDTLSTTIFQRVTINNATNIDWEDITGDSGHIYVGDCGNNDGNRANLRFYKILKSDLTPSATNVDAGKVRFSYSDQVDFSINHNNNFYDCEAFFVSNDSIHLFTKGWVNKWTKHYVVSADTGTHVAQLVDSFNVNGLITSAAIQGDTLVVLLGLNFNGGNNCFVWMFSKFQGSDYFGGNKRKFNIGSPYTTGQVEAICFIDTNKGYITNERLSLGQFYLPAQLRQFDLNNYLIPTPLIPLIETSVSTIAQNLAACSDSGSVTFTIKNTSGIAGSNLNFSIGVLPFWISATPNADTIAPGDSVIVTLNFVSGTMSGGPYAANINIHSNDQSHPTKNIFFTLDVGNNPCMNFTYSLDSCTGIVNFNSTAINNPFTYYWDFGDGDTSNAVQPYHVYSTNGNYVTTLIGCNPDGCDTVIQNIQAVIDGPVLAPCYPSTSGYCCGIGITHFRITGPAGDIFNKISNDASVGFEDFSCSAPGTMVTNYDYALSCTTATTFSEYLKIWLDLNNDGLLDSISELVYSDLDTVAPAHSGILNIPALPTNVYGVPIRMRVASDYQQSPEPCTEPNMGQHEDYSVILNYSVGVKDFLNENKLSIFPNPFTNLTHIEYALTKSSKVKLEVFNLLGERVEAFVETEVQSKGHYRFQFANQPSGIYFVRLSVNDISIIEKIVKSN